MENVAKSHWLGEKTRRGFVPITWNGIAPRCATADPLWNVLGAVLVLIADRGERVRWRSTSTPTSLEVHVLINGIWYELIPPFWKMQHWVKRLPALTARNWWDRWQLWCQHRRHIRNGEPLAWVRPVELRVQGMRISATCRVRCQGSVAEVEIAIEPPGELLATTAVAALAEFDPLVPFENMMDAFL